MLNCQEAIDLYSLCMFEHCDFSLFQNYSSHESSMAELMIKEEELTQKEELVKCLQEELVQVRKLLHLLYISDGMEVSLYWLLLFINSIVC